MKVGERRMKYVLLYNILIISWSLYLLVIHISNKDHWSFQGILVILWIVLMIPYLKRLSFSKRSIFLHSVICFGVVSGGHVLFSWIIS